MTEEMQLATSEVELMHAEAEARGSELDLVQRLCAPAYNQQLALSGAVTSERVAQLIGTLEGQRRTLEAKRFCIRLNCRGGSILPALALHDYLNRLRSVGCEIEITVTGECTGPAIVVLQAASIRICTPSSFICVEPLNDEFEAAGSEVDTRVEWIQRLEAQMISILSARCGIDRKWLVKRIAEGLLILSAKEALVHRFVDAVETPSPQGDLPIHCANLVIDPADTYEERLGKWKLREKTADALIARIKLCQKLADPDLVRVHTFFGSVETHSVERAHDFISRCARRVPGEISLLLSSNGGSIADGLGLYDRLLELTNSGNRLEVYGLGWTASMAGVLLQAASPGLRIMGANCWLLIHKAARGFSGETNQLTAQRDHLRMLEDTCFEIMSSRSHCTAKHIRRVCSHGDWWLSAKEALERGFIDTVA